MAASNSFSYFFHAPYFFFIKKSKQQSNAPSVILAGFPILTQLMFFRIPSTMLSTAIFDGAQANIFFPNFPYSLMSSQTVVVFPVPGGP